ncbi:MAG TPA: hypothetical protein DCP49_01250 [Erysipelotrichaceae bacterium]|nr:hypothetical protein [Erysipelotrichaceae bacterium]
MKKTLLCILYATALILLPVNCPIEAKAQNTSFFIQPLSDQIEWIYKDFDGVLYKRLFNYSTMEWIGRWIRV